LFEKTLITWISVLVKSVPLLALAPIICMLTGRGMATVAIITGGVAFFPTLVIVADGLAAASNQMRAIIRAFGGGRWKTLRYVEIPWALPAIAVALRISVPACITGALLVEWLATGSGVGFELMRAQSTFDYNFIWAATAILTLVSFFASWALAMLNFKHD
jgi:sulfonate transport system permease protein